MNINVIILNLIIGVLIFFMNTPLYGAQNGKPFVVPEIRQWKGHEGYTFLGDANIVNASDNKELRRICDVFSEDFRCMSGMELTVTDKSEKGKVNISFSIKKDKKLGEEGYMIKINSKKIEITAPKLIGLYWATRTLLQIAEQNEEYKLPNGEIMDYPDYGIRGFMIDCGRKYIPMSYLNDLVKIMSYYKMNTLQVHLNDNANPKLTGGDWVKTYSAFRLESTVYPGLTARDGHYTKKEFVDFQKDAMARYVEIIPEIDAPAHSLAFTKFKPEIASKELGMNYLDIYNQETYRFLDNLYDEYLGGKTPVFIGEKVHIGTDEYSKAATPEVLEKFRYFTDYYIRKVESYGKQACLWGALTYAKGKTPVKSENVIMSAWYNGYADPLKMVEDGFKLISIPDGFLYIVPAAGYYYDYLNERMLYEKWTPAKVGKVSFEEKHHAILGGMFAVWNDHIGNGISVKDIHHRTFSSLQTLSVKTWCGMNTSLSYNEFNEQRNKLSEAPGVNQLGRIGDVPGLVYERENVNAGDVLPYEEIGYDYTVSFDIEYDDEIKGTELFKSENAVIYLSDPISGMLGFSRDGYLNTFNYSFFDGESVHVEIQGNNKSTKLKINGRLVDNLEYRKIFLANNAEKSINFVRTLFFPLRKAGNFNSKIKNLKVYNYCLDK